MKFRASLPYELHFSDNASNPCTKESKPRPGVRPQDSRELFRAGVILILIVGISSTAKKNESEPESLVVRKEPKSDSGADSRPGITPALQLVVSLI